MALGTELLGVTLSTGMFARRAVSLDFPFSAKRLLCRQNPWCSWCQRKVNSQHIACIGTGLGATLTFSGSFPADTLSHPQRGVSVVAVATASTPVLSTHPWADSTKVWVALDLTGQYQRGGYLMTLKRGVNIFFSDAIKTVTLCHHHTQVLIMLLDNVPASVTAISATSEWSWFLSSSP